jgi:hypothetical protein
MSVVFRDVGERDVVAVVTILEVGPPVSPALPVAALSSVIGPRVERERRADEVDPKVLARLVRTRLLLERLRPWALMGGIGSVLLATVALALSRASPSGLVALAVTVPSLLALTTLVVDRGCRAAFLHRARAEGLSEEAAHAIHEAALGADHWIGVLESCGRAPSDDEVARFVLHR